MSTSVVVGDVTMFTTTSGRGRGTKTKMTTLAPPTGSFVSASSGGSDFRLQPDYSWSRSLSERVRGMRDSALSIVWKRRREQKLREIEARDACHWLLAAGLPQYVQLYEERQCPIDLRQVELDHANIDKTFLPTIFRRVDVLNRLTCCKATETVVQIKVADCEDNDRLLALSDRWRYVYEAEQSSSSSSSSTLIGRWVHIDHDESANGYFSKPSTNSLAPGGTATNCPRTSDTVVSATVGNGPIGNGKLCDVDDTGNSLRANAAGDCKSQDGVILVNGSQAITSQFSVNLRRPSRRKSRESSREKSPVIIVTPAATSTSNSGDSTLPADDEFVRGGSGRFSLRSARSILRRGVDSIIGRRISSGGSSTVSSSAPTQATFKHRASCGNVRPENGEPAAPTSAEFCEKMERLGCVNVRTLVTVTDGDDVTSNHGGRVQSGVSVSNGGSLPRSMSSDSLAGVLQRLALVTDCTMAVPISMELQQLPTNSVTCATAPRTTVDNARSKKLSPQNVTSDDVVECSAPDGAGSDVTRHRGGSNDGVGRGLPDVVIDARVAAPADVDVNELAIWSRYFDVCFCDCRLQPEVASFRNGSWSSTAPWWWSWSHTQSQTEDVGIKDFVDCGCDVSDGVTSGTGQSELDRILSEIDRDIVLLDETLETSKMVIDWDTSLRDNQSLDAFSNDDAQHSSCPTSPSYDVTWQYVRPMSAEQPEMIRCDDTMMTSVNESEDSHDMDYNPDSLRERRDSGVGFSLTRRQSDTKKQRGSDTYIRSLKCNGDCCERHPGHMTSGQLTLLRKLCLLHVTSVIETYSPLHQTGCNWTAPRTNSGASNHGRKSAGSRAVRRQNVFGAPLGWTEGELGGAGTAVGVGVGAGGQGRRRELTPPHSKSAPPPAAASNGSIRDGISSSSSSSACLGSLPLPPCMLRAMRFLLAGSASDAVGIFRKSGVRSRIQKLRDDIEADPDYNDFNSQPVYDVADVLKLYFHELPECLLTEKLSETFISIFTYVPKEMRMSVLKSSLALLPDENRDALYCLLSFLNRLSKFASYHQMTASNLAICFAPSLFHIYGLRPPSGSGNGPRGGSPRRDTKHSSQGSGSGLPDESDMVEQKAAHDCLTTMISEFADLITISEDITAVHRRMCCVRCVNRPFIDSSFSEQQNNVDSIAKYRSHIESCFREVFKESNDPSANGWFPVSLHSPIDVITPFAVELSYKLVPDVTSSFPRRIWRCRTELSCVSPAEVLSRLLRERHLWDDDVVKWRVVEKLDEDTDVFHYVTSPFYDITSWGLSYDRASVDFCELRSWRSDVENGTYALVSFSIDHPNARPTSGTIRGLTINSSFLIESRGATRCQLTFMSRADLRGHGSEWYRTFYGVACLHKVSRLYRSFSSSNVEKLATERSNTVSDKRPSVSHSKVTSQETVLLSVSCFFDYDRDSMRI